MPERPEAAFRRPGRTVLGLVGAFLVFRLLVAATLGLGVDETYTLAGARQLSLSNFDHPPFHYWLIHATQPWLGEGRAARLPFVLLFAGSSWVLFALTRHLFGAQAGVWTVLAFNLSAFYNYSGVGLLPDGPLEFCLLAAALAGLLFVIVGHAATGLGRAWFPKLLARDPTLETLEWTPLREELKARGLLGREGLFVVSPHWITAGKIDHALGGALPVVVFGGDQRQFAFRNDMATFVGRDALVIGREDHVGRDVAALATHFENVEELPAFPFGRSGMAEVRLRILLARGLEVPLPSAYGTAGTSSQSGL